MSINDFAITRNPSRQASSQRGFSGSSVACYSAFLVSVGFAAALVFGLIG